MGNLRRWTDEEVGKLCELIDSGVSDEEIGKLMGRTTTGIRKKRLSLGFKTIKASHGDYWTDEEDEELIRLNNEGASHKKMSEKLNRTSSSIIYRMGKLNLKSTKFWVDEEIQQLKRLNNEGKSQQEIADILGRTINAIYKKMSKLGIATKYEQPIMPHAFKVGDVVNGMKVVELSRNVKNNNRTYIVESIEHPLAPPLEVSEYSLKDEKRGCAYSAGRRIYEGNSLWSRSEIRDNIIDIEQAKTVAPNNDKPMLFKCENTECNNTKTMLSSTLLTQGFSCPNCSTGISYGQLAFEQYQTYKKLGFESEKILPGLPNRRVDFINWENGMWIEIQGEQHTNKKAVWYEDAHAQDLEKRAFAKENTQYNLIEIDMRISSWEYFKEQINKCKYLPSINKEDEISILKLMEVNKRYPIKMMRKLYVEDGLTTQEIADKLGYSQTKAMSILKRNGIKIRGGRHTKVLLIEEGKMFDTIKEASEYVGRGASTLSSHLNGRSKSCGTNPITNDPYHWVKLTHKESRLYNQAQQRANEVNESISLDESDEMLKKLRKDRSPKQSKESKQLSLNL